MSTATLEQSLKRATDYASKDRAPMVLKAVGPEGKFQGYANIFDIVDRGGDVIHHGAFAKNLKEQGSRRKLLWQHDNKTPIGMVDLGEDPVGLKVEEGEFMKGVAAAEDALATVAFWLAKGLTVEMSIGWTPVTGKTEVDDRGVYHVHEAIVYEVSIVTMAMNPESQLTSLKSSNGYANLPIGPDSGVWGPELALSAMDAAVSSGKLSSAARNQAFARVAGDTAEKSDLPFMIASLDATGRLVVNPTACARLAGRLHSGPVDGLTAIEVSDLKKHLNRYLRTMDVTPPWEAAPSLGALAKSLAQTAGPTLSLSTRTELLQLGAADSSLTKTVEDSSPGKEPTDGHSNLTGLLAELSEAAKFTVE